MEGWSLDTVHDDALLAICRWLTGSDLARLAQTCRKVCQIENGVASIAKLPERALRQRPAGRFVAVRRALSMRMAVSSSHTHSVFFSIAFHALCVAIGSVSVGSLASQIDVASAQQLYESGGLRMCWLVLACDRVLHTVASCTRVVVLSLPRARESFVRIRPHLQKHRNRRVAPIP